MLRFFVLATMICPMVWAADQFGTGVTMGGFKPGSDASEFSFGFFLGAEVAWRPAAHSRFELPLALEYGFLSEDYITDMDFWTLALTPEYSVEKFSFFGGGGYGVFSFEDNRFKDDAKGLVLLVGLDYRLNPGAQIFAKQVYFVEGDLGPDSFMTSSGDMDVSVTQVGFRWTFGGSRQESESPQKKRRTIPFNF